MTLIDVCVYICEIRLGHDLLRGPHLLSAAGGQRSNLGELALRRKLREAQQEGHGQHDVRGGRRQGRLPGLNTENLFISQKKNIAF